MKSKVSLLCLGVTMLACVTQGTCEGGLFKRLFTRTSASPDGYCPVTLWETGEWRKGDAQFTVTHEGHTYHCVGREEQDRFAQTPDKFAPYAGGVDVVAFQATHKRVPGDRRYVTYYGPQRKVYLFSTAASLKKFESAPGAYADFLERRARMVDLLDQAIREGYLKPEIPAER